MTNGSEHIPERIVLIDGVKYRVTETDENDPGVAMTLVQMKESARRLAEYEVVQ